MVTSMHAATAEAPAPTAPAPRQTTNRSRHTAVLRVDKLRVLLDAHGLATCGPNKVSHREIGEWLGLGESTVSRLLDNRGPQQDAGSAVISAIAQKVGHKAIGDYFDFREKS